MGSRKDFMMTVFSSLPVSRVALLKRFLVGLERWIGGGCLFIFFEARESSEPFIDEESASLDSAQHFFHPPSTFHLRQHDDEFVASCGVLLFAASDRPVGTTHAPPAARHARDVKKGEVRLSIVPLTLILFFTRLSSVSLASPGFPGLDTEVLRPAEMILELPVPFLRSSGKG
jgi:hypothetical protein